MRLRFENTAEQLDTVQPMWNALQEHHVRITPELDPRTPGRDLADAWRVRRSKYVRWLEDSETFFVIAEDESGPIGYAFVTVGPGYASWATGERAGVLETLSVLPDRRGGGVGAALIEAAWERLAELGVEDMAITTTSNGGTCGQEYRFRVAVRAISHQNTPCEHVTTCGKCTASPG